MAKLARIESVEELRQRYRDPVDRVLRKELDRIDGHCRAHIGEAPFVALATNGADGRLDASPRGDRPGFVQVPDERTRRWRRRRSSRLIARCLDGLY